MFKRYWQMQKRKQERSVLFKTVFSILPAGDWELITRLRYLQLGNIAQRTGRTLSINPSDGHILNDTDAVKLWSKEYQKVWEPVI
jgi:hypothetical protein